jgi:glucose/arabinose dehydrogenase
MPSKYFDSLFLSILLIGIVFELIQCNPNSQKSDEKKSALSTNIQPDSSTESAELPLHTIKLHKGFKISIFAKVHNARSLAQSPEGTVYVGNRSGDKVYAVRDENGDYKADKVYVIAEGLNMPCGVAFKNGSLFVAEISRILRFDDIEKKLANPPKPVILYDKLPKDGWHGWKFIAFGPDDKLYIPIGAPCNVCLKQDPQYASITRMNVDGSGFEVFAHGIRNSVGFDWHPESKELWFTDNGRDMLGDDLPDDELNHASKAGLHFGFPYCHAGELPDPEFGKLKACGEFQQPKQKLGAHVAALGMRFYKGNLFPNEYRRQIFIAKHGSWNRSRKVGYNITLVKLDKDKVISHQTFAEGWLDDKTQKVWGRPVDVLELPDGSILVSDDYANVIYRITYHSP